MAEKNSLFSKGSIGTFEYNLDAGNPPRAPPPKHLPPDEKEWRRVVTGLPRDWIPAGAYVLLEIYCASIVAMRAHRALMLAEPEGSPRHAKASKLYHREADMVVKLSKTLRLGPRHDRTKIRAVSTLLKPWDLGRGTGETAEPAAKGFEGFDWTPPKDDGAA